LGVRDTPPYAWNGSMPDLETQIKKTVQATMQGTPLAPEQVSDLAAYLRTLAQAPGLGNAAGDQALVPRGKEVFEKQGCAACHAPPEYTSARTYDVGLTDEAGLKKFNPPSLRGVSQGGPYFHDNRAATLEDVFKRHQHQLKAPLPEAQLKELVAFLRSL
jgi:cytochrome c peroxidase